MRKVFLFLATAALFASCADDLLEPNNGFQAQDLSSKGITFQVVKDDPATRGMFEKIEGTNSYTSFFFAEQDQVSIWAANAKLADEALGAYANGELSSVAIYKATKSETNPFLTATDEDNLLSLIDYDPNATGNTPKETVGKFFAAYPVNQTVSYVAANGTGANAVPEHFKITAIDLSSQNYNGYMNMDKRLMYAYATGSKKDNTTKEQNKSVGESVPLAFHSPLSTARFLIEDVETYKNDLGALMSITLESQYTPLLPHTGATSFDAVEGQLIDMDPAAGKTQYYKEGDLSPVFNEDGTFNAYGGTNAENEIKLENFSTKFPNGIPADYFTFDPATKKIVYVSNGIYNKLAKLTVGGSAGPAIKNNEEMNLFVLPTLERGDGHKEVYTITYQFAEATLSYKTGATDAKFEPDTKSIQFPLKIADKFKYIVTGGATSASNRSLIVNSEKFSDIFVGGTGADKNNVKWGSSSVAPTEFTSILINEKVAALTESDFEKLRNFTNVTSLTILNGTQALYPLKAKVAPATEYSGMTALTTLEAANVETVKANALPASIVNLTLKSATTIEAQDETLGSLATLILPKYQFSNGVKPSVFFTTTNGKNNILKYLDLSSVETLCSTPGQSTSISFKGYEALDSVKLRDAGTEINSYQFSGCKKLQKVTGMLDITDAKYAFENCIWTEKDDDDNVVGTFDNVRISGKVIPEGAFKGSTVKTIYYGQTGNTQVVPTSIGKDAFSGNKAIEAMDLSKATTIGTGAFNGATSFVGMPDNHHYDAVVLIVEAVAENAFNGTNIVNFFLQNATSTGANSLASSAVDQIMYAADLDEDYDEEEESPISDTQVTDDQKENVQIFVSNDGDKGLFGDYNNVRKYDFTK